MNTAQPKLWVTRKDWAPIGPFDTERDASQCCRALNQYGVDDDWRVQ